MEKKEQKTSNFGTAVYIAETRGYNIPDEKLIKIAKALKLKPSVLIKNYRSVVNINQMLESLGTP